MSVITGAAGNSPGRSAITVRKGFASAYAVIVLMAVIVISGSVADSAAKYYSFSADLEEFRMINRAEILTIYHVKQLFRNYQEEDEVLEIDDCTVSIRFDDLTCSIEISGPTMSRSRTMIFDDINDIVKDYY